MKINEFGTGEEASKTAARSIAGTLTDGGGLFISGGSSFKVFEALDAMLSDSQKEAIDIYQVDERFGPPNHEASNWVLAEDIDMAKYGSASPMLDDSLSVSEVATRYADRVAELVSENRTMVAILGIGDDHHVAGVKPMDKDRYEEVFGDKVVAEYQWSDFHRITMTVDALVNFNAIMVYAEGVAKRAAIDSLNSEEPEYSSPAHGLLKNEHIEIYYAKG